MLVGLHLSEGLIGAGGSTSTMDHTWLLARRLVLCQVSLSIESLDVLTMWAHWLLQRECKEKATVLYTITSALFCLWEAIHKVQPPLKGAIIIGGRSFNIHFSFSKIPLKVRIDRSSYYQILKYILASTFYCLSWNKGCIYFSFQNPSCHLCFGVRPLLPSGRPCCAIIPSPKSCPYKHTLVSLSSSKQNKTLLWPISPFHSQNSWVNHLYTVSNLSPPIYSST